METAHYKLRSAHYKLRTAHYKLNTAHWTLDTAGYKLHNENCIEHCILNITHSEQYYILHTVYCRTFCEADTFSCPATTELSGKLGQFDLSDPRGYFGAALHSILVGPADFHNVRDIFRRPNF